APLAFGAMVRSDRATGGFGELSVQWIKGLDIVGFERRGFLIGGAYQQEWSSFLAPPKAEGAQWLLRSGFGESWQWMDDLIALGPGLINGGFETEDPVGGPSGWTRRGTPVQSLTGTDSHRGMGAVRLGDGDGLEQGVAVVGGADYQLRFFARSDAVLTSGSVTVVWRGKEGEELATDTLRLLVGASFERFAYDFEPPVGAQTAWVELMPRGLFGGELWVDDAMWWWGAASPGPFSPNGDDMRDTTTLFLFQPSASRVAVVVEAPSGQGVRVLRNGDTIAAGVNATMWDGRDRFGNIVADGAYRFVGVREESDGTLDSLKVGIGVESGRVYSQAPASAPQDFFPRGVFTLLGGRQAPKNYGPIFEDMREEGFNTAVLLRNLPVDRRTDALDAAEAAGIRVLLESDTVFPLVAESRGYGVVSAEETNSVVRELADLVAGRSGLLGFYLFDEPQERHVEALRLIEAELREAAPGVAQFTTYARTPDPAVLDRALAPAAVMYDDYPLGVDEGLGAKNPDDFVASYGPVLALARGRGVPFWPVVQAFGLTEGLRNPTGSEVRVQVYLSLALGAKGVFYFLHESSGSLQGLLDLDYERTEKWESVRGLNKELELLAGDLLELESWDGFEATWGNSLPLFAGKFRDGAGRPVLIVVNKDVSRPAEGEIGVTGIGAIRARELRGGRLLPVKVEAGSRRLRVELGAGDGAVVRFE
ncbi:MAG: hypothetical protein V2A74_05050, partial [bacterium]